MVAIWDAEFVEKIQLGWQDHLKQCWGQIWKVMLRLIQKDSPIFASFVEKSSGINQHYVITKEDNIKFDFSGS